MSAEVYALSGEGCQSLVMGKAWGVWRFVSEKDEDAGLRVRIHLLSSCCCTDYSLGRLHSKFYSHFKNTFHPRSHLLPPLQQQFHVSHFKKILSSLLVCPPSPRNSPSKRSSGNGRLEADVGIVLWIRGLVFMMMCGGSF